jgi:NRPS condensation-like uncharacterized protein
LDPKIPSRLPAVAQDRMVYHNAPVIDPQFQFVLEFEGRLDEARVKRAVRLAMDAEPVFGCQYVERRPPYWKRRDDLDRLPLCEVVEASDPQPAMAEFITRRCNASLDPLIQTRIVRGRNDTLCLKISHVAADGAGGGDLLYLIATLYRSLQDPSYRVTPNLGSRSRMQWFRHAGLRRSVKAFRSRLAKPAENQWRFPSTNRDHRGGVKSALRQLDAARFDSLRAYAKRAGSTLNDVLTAAYFRSLCQFLEAGIDLPQTIILPMNVRRYLPSGKTQAICNFTAPLYLPLARIPGEPFDATLRRVTAGTRDAEARKEHALAAAMAISLGYRLAAPRMKLMVEAARCKSIEDGRTIAFLSNFGSIDPARLDFGLPLTDASLISPPATAPALFLVVHSFRGALRFMVTYYSSTMKSDDVEGLLDSFLRELPANEVRANAHAGPDGGARV